MTRQELQAAIKLLAYAEDLPAGNHRALTGYERENLHMARALLQIMDAHALGDDMNSLVAVVGAIERAMKPLYEDGER